MANHRTTLSYAVVLLFLVSFLWAGFQNKLDTSFPLLSSDRPEDFKGTS